MKTPDQLAWAAGSGVLLCTPKDRHLRVVPGVGGEARRWEREAGM